MTLFHVWFYWTLGRMFPRGRRERNTCILKPPPSRIYNDETHYRVKEIKSIMFVCFLVGRDCRLCLVTHSSVFSIFVNLWRQRLEGGDVLDTFFLNKNVCRHFNEQCSNRLCTICFRASDVIGLEVESVEGCFFYLNIVRFCTNCTNWYEFDSS